MDYTLKQFEIDFKLAENIDKKLEVLNNLIQLELSNDNIDIKDKIKEYKDKIQEYKDKIQDYKDDILKYINNRCNYWIDNGKANLYVCKKEVPNFDCIVGRRYYIKYDDISKNYSEILKGMDDQDILKYINNIDPIITIVTDNGIGTLKKWQILILPKELNFNDYFYYEEI